MVVERLYLDAVDFVPFIRISQCGLGYFLSFCHDTLFLNLFI